MNATIHQLGDAGLLTLGAKGEAVTAVQRSLNALRVTFIAVPEDGVFTIDTANAVKAFQSKVKLPTTGAVDSATREALARSLPQRGASSALAASVPMTGVAPTATAKLPLWQAGLMALGGIALVGGVFWALTREEETKPVKTTDATLAGTDHVKPLKSPTKVAKDKCPVGKTPSDHASGEPILA